MNNIKARREKIFMKKTASIVLGIMILICVSFAKDLTLDEAINLAKQNNSEILTLNADQRQQEKDYKSAKRDNQKWETKKGYSISTAEEYLLHTGDALKTAQLKYDTYLKSIENAENKIEYNLISTLYNLKLAEKNIEILEETVKLMERQKLVYELKYKVNWITKLDLDNFLLSLNQTKNTLENAKIKYELGKENAKIMLGESEEVKVILPNIDNSELKIEDIKEYCDENIEKNKSLMELRYNYKLLENQYMATKEGFYDDLISNPAFQIKVLKDQYEAMKHQIDIVVNNLSTAYASHYNDIKMSDLSLVEQKNKLELAKANMEIIKTRYEAGYVAELDYELAKINLQQSELAYESEKINNMLLKEKFKRFTESGFTTME